MLNEQQKRLIITLPETEYGRALWAWIQYEIDLLEHKEEVGAKICNDPLIEDFRTQMGIKIAFKRVLRKPQELLEQFTKGVR